VSFSSGLPYQPYQPPSFTIYFQKWDPMMSRLRLEIRVVDMVDMANRMKKTRRL